MEKKCKQLQKNSNQEIVSQDFAASGKVYKKNIVVFYTMLLWKGAFCLRN